LRGRRKKWRIDQRKSGWCLFAAGPREEAAETASDLDDVTSGGRGQDHSDLLPSIEAGDILIDGGNSYYLDDIRGVL
jgi:hypothetical protein